MLCYRFYVLIVLLFSDLRFKNLVATVYYSFRTVCLTLYFFNCTEHLHALFFLFYDEGLETNRRSWLLLKKLGITKAEF